MIRLITARRLRTLLDDLRQASNDAHRLHLQAQQQLTGKLLAEQARDHFREQADYWKSRATRFIDHEQLKAGTIDSPVMGEATQPAANSKQRIMSALNVREIHKQSPSDGAPVGIIGVSERAAREAVAGIFDS